MAERYLGVDFGTSVVKGTLLAPDDPRPIRQVTKRYSEVTGDRYEDMWWNVLCECISELLEDQAKLTTLAITAMIPNILLINPLNNTPVGPCLLFYDSRAYDIELKLDKDLGTKPWANESLSKLLWLKNSLPDGIFTTRPLLLTTHSYLVWRLTGRHCIDSLSAAEMGSLYDEINMTWNWTLIDSFGLSDLQWPDIVPGASIVGTIQSSSIPKLLFGEASVVAGTADTLSTCFGAGMSQAGERLFYYGTFNCSAELGADVSVCLNSHLTQPPFIWQCSIPRAGQQLESLARILFPSTTLDASVRAFDLAAAASSAGAKGLVFLHAPNISRTTVSTEPYGRLIDLRVDHQAEDIARAVLEAFAYTLRWSYENIGMSVVGSRAFSAGGGARSTLWRQIVSDVTGVEQVYIAAADRGIGAALIAAWASDPKACEYMRSGLMASATVTSPDHTHTGDYSDGYERFLKSWTT